MPKGAVRGANLAVTVLWGMLLATVFAWPNLRPVDNVGDFLTRGTIRIALLYYTVTVSLLLWPGASASPPRPQPAAPARDALPCWRGGLARWCWTLAWAAYLVHLTMAFHHYHHWSHAHAVEHTRAVSGVGEGIYVSHVFTLLWTADVAWWWLWPAARAARPIWIDRSLHGFLFFMVWCATVVYETGLIRWAGVALTAWLAGLWLLRGACRAGRPTATTEGRPAASP